MSRATYAARSCFLLRLSVLAYPMVQRWTWTVLMARGSYVDPALFSDLWGHA